MRWGVATILFVSLAPLAMAAPVEGRLVAEGSVILPPGARVISSPQAVFVPDADAASLDLSAQTVTLHLYEDRYLTVATPGARPVIATGSRRASWELHDVQMVAEPSRGGWFGLRPAAGTLEEASLSEVSIDLAAAGAVGNADAAAEDSPSHPYFSVALDGPTLLRAAGEWRYEGGGSLKLLGPTLRIEARENATRIETGEMPDPDNAAQTLRRHVVIEFDNGQANARGPSEIASAELVASWNGPAEISQATGTLSAATREWSADGERALVEGELVAVLRANASGNIGVSISGDMWRTSLRSETRIAIPSTATPSSLVILALGAAVVGGAGILLARRRRERQETPIAFHADELASLAYEAGDAEDYERAAELLAAARERSPTSRRLAIDHAFYLSRAGDQDAARSILGTHLLREDADALLLLTRLQMERGEDAAAAASLIRALDAQPVVVLDVQDDPAYDRLVGRPDVAAALRRSRRSLD